ATHRLLSTGGLSGFSTLRGSNKANAPRPSFFCKNTRLASTCASSRLCVDSTRGAVRRCGEASPSRCTKSAIMGKSSTPAATVRPAGLGDQGSRRGSPFGSGLEAGTNGELYGARLIVVKVRPVPAITPESAPEKHSGRLTSSASDAPGRGACVLGCGFALGWRWPHLYGWWGSQGCFGHAGAFRRLRRPRHRRRHCDRNQRQPLAHGHGPSLRTFGFGHPASLARDELSPE